MIQKERRNNRISNAIFGGALLMSAAIHAGAGKKAADHSEVLARLGTVADSIADQIQRKLNGTQTGIEIREQQYKATQEINKQKLQEAKAKLRAALENGEDVSYRDAIFKIKEPLDQGVELEIIELGQRKLDASLAESRTKIDPDKPTIRDVDEEIIKKLTPDSAYEEGRSVASVSLACGLCADSQNCNAIHDIQVAALETLWPKLKDNISRQEFSTHVQTVYRIDGTDYILSPKGLISVEEDYNTWAHTNTIMPYRSYLKIYAGIDLNTVETMVNLGAKDSDKGQDKKKGPVTDSIVERKGLGIKLGEFEGGEDENPASSRPFGTPMPEDIIHESLEGADTPFDLEIIPSHVTAEVMKAWIANDKLAYLKTVDNITPKALQLLIDATPINRKGIKDLPQISLHTLTQDLALAASQPNVTLNLLGTNIPIDAAVTWALSEPNDIFITGMKKIEPQALDLLFKVHKGTLSFDEVTADIAKSLIKRANNDPEPGMAAIVVFTRSVTPEAARIIAEEAAFPIVISASYFSKEAAAELAKTEQNLHIDADIYRDGALEELTKYKGILSPENFNNGFTVEEAQIIARVQAKRLIFGDRTLYPEIARALKPYRGELQIESDYIYPDALEELVQSEIAALQPFPYGTTVTPQLAMYVAQFRGETLKFPIEKMTKDIAEALSTFHQNDPTPATKKYLLSLWFTEEIDLESAKAFVGKNFQVRLNSKVLNVDAQTMAFLKAHPETFDLR